METKIEQTITEQLISFKTAKLAKEKGFEVIIDSQKSYYNAEGIVRHYNWFNFAEFTILVEAPTQALLQRWLREKHKLHIYILWYGVYEVYMTREKIAPEIIQDGFDTYEAALEVGLNVSLELIYSNGNTN